MNVIRVGENAAVFRDIIIQHQQLYYKSKLIRILFKLWNPVAWIPILKWNNMMLSATRHAASCNICYKEERNGSVFVG